MSGGIRIPLADAQGFAQEVVDRLAPDCERIEIAGSIRRQEPDVGDIELVAMPRMSFDRDVSVLFSESIEVSRLAEKVALLRTEGFLSFIESDVKDGERYQKLRHVRSGMQVDLFHVRPPATWGVILAIRTGPAEFSHWLVTEARRRGLHVKDGALHRGGLSCGAIPCEVIPTDEEGQFFDALGVAWRPPHLRGARWR